MESFKRTKDPAEIDDRGYDFASDLEDGEAIVSALVEVAAGLVLEASGFEDTIATARISGGAAGDTYRVSFQITTSNGRTLRASGLQYVEER